MFGLGTGELAIFAGIVLLLFGGKKLPQLGGALASSIKNFKKGLAEPAYSDKPQNENDRKNDNEHEKEIS